VSSGRYAIAEYIRVRQLDADGQPIGESVIFKLDPNAERVDLVGITDSDDDRPIDQLSGQPVSLRIP
jgi:hypothetical protein